MSRCSWIFVAMLLFAASVRADDNLPPGLRDVGIDQHLGQTVPLDLHFHDETGRDVELGNFFAGKPVILVLAYYRCPMLCTQVLNGVADALKKPAFQLKLGEDFQIVTVSFDAREDKLLRLVAAKKENYVNAVRDHGHPQAVAGWHFLTGEQAAINRLAEAVGFRYHYDAEKDQFAHASAIMVLTPGGKVSHYFFGITFLPQDVRFALEEASDNKIGSVTDHVLLLFCYHYDPAAAKYTLQVLNLVRLGAAVTVLGIGFLLFRGWRRRQAVVPASLEARPPAPKAT